MSRIKRVTWAGFLTVVGFLLSPLSWWNDLVVNWPIAYGVAYLVAKLNHDLFLTTLLLTYWMTNLLGLLMFHHGTIELVKPEVNIKVKNKLVYNLILSGVYSLLVYGMFKFGLFKLPN